MTALWNGAVKDQVTGVAAQIAFGAPALVASLVVARVTEVRLVSDLAIAFSATATIFVALSFNLSHHLTLWGQRGFTDHAFWLNRILASAIAAVTSFVLLVTIDVDSRIALLAAGVKLADAFGDLKFGFRMLEASPGSAMRFLLGWSLVRLLLLLAASFAALGLGFPGESALAAGSALQLVVMVPWRDLARTSLAPDMLRAAGRLARQSAHLGVAATASGLLVTTPRLIAPRIASPAELGYLGIAFIASALIGMWFYVAWLRLASAMRSSDALRAVRRFLIEGVALGLVLVAGLWLSVPLVAAIYDVDSALLSPAFLPLGTSLVLLYFAMAIANLLKTAAWRFLEAASYLVAAAGLAGFSLYFESLVVGVLAASIVLLVFVSLGVPIVGRLLRG